MKIKNLSLRKKLILIFIITFTIPLITSSIIFIKNETKQAKEYQNAQDKNNINFVSYEFSKILSDTYAYSLYLNINESILNFLKASENVLYEKQLNYKAQEVVSTIVIRNELISSIQILSKLGNRIFTGSPSYLPTEYELQEVDISNGKPIWLKKIENNQEKLYMIRLIKDPQNLGHKLGYIIIEVSNKHLQDVINKLDEIYGNSSYKYILKDQFGNELYNSFQKSNTSKVLLNTVKINYNDFILEQYSTFDTNINIISSVYEYYWIYILICIFFSFFLASTFTRYILKPIRTLGTVMKKVENGNYKARINPIGNDELAILSKQFDKMSEKLQESYEQIYLSNLHAKETELAMLQAQINPHFLYNTLDTIYWMSEIHKTSDVSDMVSSLSQLFRLSLSQSNTAFIPLDQELKHVNTYSHIQKVRHGDALRIEIINNIKEPLLVPKLIIQPLLENAIIHGVDIVGKGFIQITINKTDSALIYNVEDDVGLLDAEKVNHNLNNSINLSSKQKGIGLNNINNRIKIICGKQFGIYAHCDGKTSAIRVILPLKKEVMKNDNISFNR